MIKTAIIDDEKEILTAVKRCIENIEELKGNIKLYSFLSAEQFLEKMEQGEEFHILITDIGLQGMDGMELGRIVKRKQPQMYLVFLTSYTEFAVDSYSMEAYQYILKQEMDSRLPKVLKQIIYRMRTEEYIIIKTGIERHRLYYRDIIYIHKGNASKYSEFVTSSGKYNDRINIAAVMEQLHSDDFIMPDRSTIINIKHIDRMNGEFIYMDNKIRIEISRARCLEVKGQINRNWGRCV